MTQFLQTPATMMLLMLSVFLSVSVLGDGEAELYLDTVTKGASGEEVPGTEEIKEEFSCQMYEDVLEQLRQEKELLRSELDAIKARLEAAALQEMEEDESFESNESHSRSRGLRGKRATTCEGGTVNQWACGPQCIYKLKGLCGLSLRAMCHC